MTKKTGRPAFLFITALIFSAAITACSSVPDSIPEDLDASQLIQLGQDSFDAHRYKAAELYFDTVLERYGDDAKHYVEAKYELGHLYLRQKKYQAAYNNFTDILEIYENVPIGLPGAYKILCNIELEKIPENKIVLPGTESEEEAGNENAATEDAASNDSAYGEQGQPQNQDESTEPAAPQNQDEGENGEPALQNQDEGGSENAETAE